MINGTSESNRTKKQVGRDRKLISINEMAEAKGWKGGEMGRKKEIGVKWEERKKNRSEIGRKE